MIFILLITTLLIQCTFAIHETTCEESQKYFADICFKPKVPTEAFDIGWFIGSQPDDGHYIPLVNDISRHHFSEVLHGKLLSRDDNFDNACIRTSSQLGAEGLEANFTGFGGLISSWNCRVSQDNIGIFLCEGFASGPSKYHEGFTIYPVFSDHENFQFGVLCFGTGEVGWYVMSNTPTLTDEETKIIAEEVKKLGFQFEDAVISYPASCPQ